MEELKLRYYPDPILREETEPIDSFDDELRVLAGAMVEKMIRERGIGLAAPQVGVKKRLSVILQMKDAEDADAEPLVLVNPKVTTTSGELWSFEEGCLSIPGINAAVLRPTHAEVEYQDLDGNAQHISADGMLARILLHEVDHLYGKLFIDYLSSAQKSLIKTKLKALAQDKPSS